MRKKTRQYFTNNRLIVSKDHCPDMAKTVERDVKPKTFNLFQEDEAMINKEETSYTKKPFYVGLLTAAEIIVLYCNKDSVR